MPHERYSTKTWLFNECNVSSPPQTHLFRRSVSDSRLMGLGQGLHELTDPRGEPSTPIDRVVTALAVLL